MGFSGVDWLDHCDTANSDWYSTVRLSKPVGVRNEVDAFWPFRRRPGSNPVIQCLQANGAGGLPGGTLYNNRAGTRAHENLHFTRFQNYVNSELADFLSTIDQFSIPIQSFPTIQEAKAEATRLRFPSNAKTDFNNAATAVQIRDGGLGDHTPEADFYNEGVGGIADLLGAIQFRRVLFSCSPLPVVCGP